MPRFKSIIFYQYSPKIKLFSKKMQNFQALGAPLPDFQYPRAPGGSATKPKEQPPQLRISGNAPATLCTVYNHMGFCSFCFEQFFLHCSVAHLMMLTIDICLIVFLFEKFDCLKIRIV